GRLLGGRFGFGLLLDRRQLHHDLLRVGPPLGPVLQGGRVRRAQRLEGGGQLQEFPDDPQGDAQVPGRGRLRDVGDAVEVLDRVAGRRGHVRGDVPFLLEVITDVRARPGKVVRFGVWFCQGSGPPVGCGGRRRAAWGRRFRTAPRHTGGIPTAPEI